MRDLTQNECGHVAAGAETVYGQLAIVSCTGGAIGLIGGVWVSVEMESLAAAVYTIYFGALGAVSLPLALWTLGNMVAFTYNVGFSEY